MTAIFAYADGDVAFVAGDAARTYPVFGRLNAIKVHRWSDTVLLAQAGDGVFLTRLLLRMRERAPAIRHHHASLASDQQFIQAFQSMRPNYVSGSIRAGGRGGGIVLIAAAADAFGPARINSVDFASGALAPPTAAVVLADGADPVGFTAQAKATLPSNRAGWQIDDWAVDCIDFAIRGFPQDVGYPAHMLLSRASTSGSRYTLERSFTPGSPRALAEFRL